MSGADLPAAVEEAIAAALDEYGVGPRTLVPISPIHGLKHDRYTLLVETGDGARIKARSLDDAAEAESLCELRHELGPAFAPVLHRRGAVLIEEWIEGATAGPEEAAGRAAEAGSVLGKLHARPLGEDEPEEQRTTRYTERAHAELERLASDERLTPDTAEALLAEVETLDPGAFRPALIHRDFCAENFVIDDGGRLVVIDNEWFEIGAPGFDLARTYHRWPMPAPAWERFRRAHREAAGEVEALRFWMVSTALFGAGVYQRLSDPRVDPLLELLGALAAGQAPYESE